MNNRKNLDVILSVVLVGFLAYFSFKWLRASGPLKLAGGLLLAILIADILSTSKYWLWILTGANKYENKFSTKVEGWKHVSGA